MKRILGVLILSLMSTPTWAITLDGSTAGDGYVLAATQTNPTSFGDNQSELNAAWAKFEGSNLNLVLTGNLHDFNKLTIFFDVAAGGQNVIGPDTNNGGSNPPNDNWASELSGIGPNTPGNPGPGFTFDAGFDADFNVIVRRNAGFNTYDIDYSIVGGGAAGFESAGNVFGGSADGSNANALPINGIGVAHDNSNVLGVDGAFPGAANQAAAQAVATGTELSIPLAALGNPAVGSVIKISAFINGGNHDFLSNQILSGYPINQGQVGGDNLGNFTGDASRVNLNAFAGDQCFPLNVIPEPSTLALAGLSGLGMVASVLRRKK